MTNNEDEMKKYLESIPKIEKLFNKFGSISITLLQRNFSLNYDEAKVWHDRYMRDHVKQ